MSRNRNNPTPNATEKIAALLLTLRRPNDRGTLEPIIPWDHAKQMTAHQICSLFEWDHAVFDTWHGSNHPTNLTPLLISEHRAKTRNDQGVIAKVRRGTKKRSQPKQAGRWPNRAFPKPPAGAKFDWKAKRYAVIQKPAE